MKRGDLDGKSEIGRALAILREGKGMTRAGLAEASGVPHWAVAEYERGDSTPDRPTLERLLAALGSSPVELAGLLTWLGEPDSPALAGNGLTHALEVLVASRLAPRLRPVHSVESSSTESLAAARRAWELLASWPPADRLALIEEVETLQSTAMYAVIRGEGERCAAGSQHADELATLVAAVVELLPDAENGAPVIAHSLAGTASATEALLERRDAPRLWRRLRRHPPERRPTVVELGEDFWSWGLVELLCEESIGEAARDPAAAEGLARLALAVAGRIPGTEAWRERVCGYAAAAVANAQRVQGHLREAEATFAKAKQLWQAGSEVAPGLLDASLPRILEAALRRGQRRLRDSLALLELALGEARSDRSIGRVLLSQAKALEELGAYDRAVATLRQATPHLERAGDRRLQFGLRFNLLENEFQAGYPVDVPTRLAEVQALAERQGNAIDRIRVRWLEGRLAAGMGRRAEAEKAFLEVRDAFVARKMTYDTALAVLELAIVLLEEGRQMDVRELALWVEPIFRAEGVHREATAALCLFHQAVLSETATAEMAREVLGYLLRSRHDASFRFHGFGCQGQSSVTEALLPQPPRED